MWDKSVDCGGKGIFNLVGLKKVVTSSFPVANNSFISINPKTGVMFCRRESFFPLPKDVTNDPLIKSARTTGTHTHTHTQGRKRGKGGDDPLTL